jgi:hypothetical protein
MLLAGFGEDAADTVSQLLYEFELSEHARNDWIADFGDALFHILDRHAGQKDPRIFDFDTIIEERDANRRALI